MLNDITKKISVFYLFNVNKLLDLFLFNITICFSLLTQGKMNKTKQ